MTTIPLPWPPRGWYYLTVHGRGDGDPNVRHQLAVWCRHPTRKVRLRRACAQSWLVYLPMGGPRPAPVVHPFLCPPLP